jgi:hypothetical protein
MERHGAKIICVAFNYQKHSRFGLLKSFTFRSDAGRAVDFEQDDDDDDDGPVD